MNPDPDTNTAMMLGEMRAQLRELVHQGNNQVQKNDAVARTIAQLESIPKDIAEIKDRLTTLETDRTRRDSERSVITAFMQSRALGWIVGAVTTVWLYITGRLTL